MYENIIRKLSLSLSLYIYIYIYIYIYERGGLEIVWVRHAEQRIWKSNDIVRYKDNNSRGLIVEKNRWNWNEKKREREGGKERDTVTNNGTDRLKDKGDTLKETKRLCDK